MIQIGPQAQRDVVWCCAMEALVRETQLRRRCDGAYRVAKACQAHVRLTVPPCNNNPSGVAKESARLLVLDGDGNGS